MARRFPAGTNTTATAPRRESAGRKALGSVRRAQQITTYGVGAMIAIGDQSFIVSGLDSWDVSEADTLHEPRLEGPLGVDHFCLPPAGEADSGRGVKVRRFPETYSCPSCEALRRLRDFGNGRNDNSCGDCGSKLTPSRFVVACDGGHLAEFPYWDWLHRRRDEERRAQHSCDRRRARLSLRSEGRTASLQGIVVACDCGESGSLEGAFGRDAMASLRIGCLGLRPWLGRDGREDGCDRPLRVLQRGSSAAWFPAVASALSIPPWHRRLTQLVERQRRHLLGKTDARIREFAHDEGWLAPGRYSAEEVIEAVRTLEGVAADAERDPDDIDAFAPGSRLRREEYRQLCAETPELPENEHFVCVPPASTEKVSVPGIERTMLVKRLREVRALRGFTRIEPPADSEAGRRRRARLALGPDVDWLPAIEVIGEGVFLTLDPERLGRWESRRGPSSPHARAEAVRHNHERALRSRAEDPLTVAPSPVTSRLLLLHTFAHALITEWSLDCGYPASALRERLYVDDDMAGVLLYTATSDSAGSLGGIVAQGEPAALAASLRSALARVSWCSADPLCMEADASGVDSLNLAACHACVLFPETSCELNNTFLDRALLIGTPDGEVPGFFSA
ncbi:DUF1998 domain-containing protein [Streptomyces sp. DSM 44917]|uniref:DUF1998 domain-containing protein n=1 Tax=Streptomyces boetiae TaxID=3075541 RepID=A0ABU2LA57_9ACTN|nr:DUF1998 domain-containing protein [Streptomyces sp. DSM 44917]MDT0308370.1 DUF1998 domain-containing protein [Streptomyces sp. DSM 44917]